MPSNPVLDDSLGSVLKGSPETAGPFGGCIACRPKDGVKAAEEMLDGIGSISGGDVASWNTGGDRSVGASDWDIPVSEEVG